MLKEARFFLFNILCFQKLNTHPARSRFYGVVPTIFLKTVAFRMKGFNSNGTHFTSTQTRETGEYAVSI